MKQDKIASKTVQCLKKAITPSFLSKEFLFDKKNINRFRINSVACLLNNVEKEPYLYCWKFSLSLFPHYNNNACNRWPAASDRSTSEISFALRSSNSLLRSTSTTYTTIAATSHLTKYWPISSSIFQIIRMITSKPSPIAKCTLWPRLWSMSRSGRINSMLSIKSPSVCATEMSFLTILMSRNILRERITTIKNWKLSSVWRNSRRQKEKGRDRDRGNIERRPNQLYCLPLNPKSSSSPRG